MIPWLDPNLPPHFPDTFEALENPNGLLAAGGRLNVEWLLVAYRQGIFPWFCENEPILWWSPEPRTVLLPENFHSSRSLTRLSRQQRYYITRSREFADVVNACAQPRKTQAETWIVPDMVQAYNDMHKAGIAHSFECRDDQGNLVGGVYGVVLGRVFFGESMFSRASNTSKLCLKHILECGEFDLLDCQMSTDHLMSLGATEIERETFESYLNRYIE